MSTIVENFEIASSEFSQYDQRQPDIDWVDFHHRLPARMVVPVGHADESLLSFDADQLEDGWREAQVAQTIAAVYMEMFDKDLPSYDQILDSATAWQQRMMDAWWKTQEIELQTGCEMLQSIINAARAGLKGQPTAWSPTQRRLEVEAAPTLTPDGVKLGKWHEARSLDGERWRVRKHGDSVQAETLDRRFNASIELTKKQARMTMKVIRPFGQAA